MHCPNCGAEHTFGLKYCKRCGGNLSDAPSPSWPVSVWKFTGAAWAVGLATVAICLGGLGIVFSFVYDLVRPLPGHQMSDELMPIAMAMIVFGSAIIFGIAALLIRLFSRLLSPPQETNWPAQLARPEYPVSQLPAQSSGIPSVTEHTTRNFEPIERITRSRQTE